MDDNTGQKILERPSRPTSASREVTERGAALAMRLNGPGTRAEPASVKSLNPFLTKRLLCELKFYRAVVTNNNYSEAISDHFLSTLLGLDACNALTPSCPCRQSLDQPNLGQRLLKKYALTVPPLPAVFSTSILTTVS